MAEIISYAIVGFSILGGLLVISAVVGKHNNKPKDYYND